MSLLRRWWWLVAVIVLGTGLSRLRFDADVLNLLPRGLPAVEGLRLQAAHFATQGELMVTVEAPDAATAATAAQRAAEALRVETNLVAAATWRPPWQDHPADTAEFLAWLWLNQPPEALAALVTSLAPDRLPARLAEAREALATSMSPQEIGRAGYDPLGLTALPGGGGGGLEATQGEGLFASADGTFRLVFVEPVAGQDSFGSVAPWVDAVRARLDRLREAPDWPAEARLALTGKPAFVAEASTGMHSDIRSSVAGTLGVIGLLFWLAHRRLGPMLWLGLMLQVILLATLALGGLLVGTLNLVSFGFAAILMGLAVDYGLILYQEARERPGATASEIRRAVGGAIRGSALTTAAAFVLLLFGGLPGLGQLGLLVGVGVLVGALVMTRFYLPLVRRGLGPAAAAVVPPAAPGAALKGGGSGPALAATAGIVVAAALVLGRAFPPLDHGTQSLGPRHSPADAAMKQVEARLGRDGGAVIAVVSAPDEATMHSRLSGLAAWLGKAKAQGRLAGFDMPLSFWPGPGWQPANRSVAAGLAARAPEFRAALDAAGFSADAAALADGMFQAWERFAGTEGIAWPSSESSRWLLDRAVARTPDGWLALGLLSGKGADAVAAAGESGGLDGVTFCGWQLLGQALLGHIETRVAWLVAAMGLALAAGLRWTLGSWREVGLSFATLGFGLMLLLSGMAVMEASWNLMNLTALPLLLGAGVDYAIHVQLALRRHGGDAAAMRRTTGRALWLCAGTTIAGFGSLAWSSNAGLASLGAVCAAGVGCVLVTALYFLPAWHYAARRRSRDVNSNAA